MNEILARNEMKITCPHCTQRIALTPAWAGHLLHCPTCLGAMTVPQDGAVQSAARLGLVPERPAPSRSFSSTFVSPTPMPVATSTCSVAPRSRLAVVSLVSSLAIFLLPLNSIAAIICGHLARRRFRANPNLRGARLATAGLCIGYLSLAIGIAWISIAIAIPAIALLSAASGRPETANGSQAGAAMVPMDLAPSGLGITNGPVVSSVFSQMGVQSVDQPANSVRGRLGGTDFKCDRATLDHGWLKLSQGQDLFSGAELEIVLFESTQKLAGRTIVIQPGSLNAPHLHLRWQEKSGLRHVATVVNNYSMTLKLGPMIDGHISGSVRLESAGQARTTLSGDFIAEAR